MGIFLRRCDRKKDSHCSILLCLFPAGVTDIPGSVLVAFLPPTFRLVYGDFYEAQESEACHEASGADMKPKKSHSFSLRYQVGAWYDCDIFSLCHETVSERVGIVNITAESKKSYAIVVCAVNVVSDFFGRFIC